MQVDIYAKNEAVFTVTAPFPLYQALDYTVRFVSQEPDGADCVFRYTRWDEAFTDIVRWTGERQVYRLAEVTADAENPLPLLVIGSEDDRSGGAASWRVVLPEGSWFSFRQAENYQLTYAVGSSRGA